MVGGAAESEVLAVVTKELAEAGVTLVKMR